MASEHVLRIARTDSKGDYVLLNISSNGSTPLDLKLLATEGTAPFIKICKLQRLLFSYRIFSLIVQAK